MKIEKINDNKLKIMFDYTELEENNISIHSFLANSIEVQNFFLAILDIANEDLDFKPDSSNLSYETISFGNKFFVIFVTKSDTCNDFKDIINFKSKEMLYLLYKIDSMDEVFSFCYILNSILPSTKKIKSSLYEYNGKYFIKLDIKNLDTSLKEQVSLIISEFKDNINLSDLSLLHFEEFSSLLIKDTAIQKLCS